jgi:predicted nucleic acid-binding protein
LEQAELYAQAFEIAIRSSLPIYDTLFIALAKARRVPLITSDPSQAEAARKLGVEVELII